MIMFNQALTNYLYKNNKHLSHAKKNLMLSKLISPKHTTDDGNSLFFVLVAHFGMYVQQLGIVWK